MDMFYKQGQWQKQVDMIKSYVKAYMAKHPEVKPIHWPAK
jgi:hypothetical protein